MLLYDLVINESPRGPNGREGLLRMHWAKRNRYRDRWGWLIRSALGNVCAVEPPKMRVRVHIHQFRKRLLDEDNLYSSVKVLLDGMVSWCLLYKDDPAHCTLTVTQEKSKKPSTHIMVYDAD